MSLIVSPVSRHRLETWIAWGDEGHLRSRSSTMTVSYTYKILFYTIRLYRLLV